MKINSCNIDSAKKHIALLILSVMYFFHSAYFASAEDMAAGILKEICKPGFVKEDTCMNTVDILRIDAVVTVDLTFKLGADGKSYIVADYVRPDDISLNRGGSILAEIKDNRKLEVVDILDTQLGDECVIAGPSDNDRSIYCLQSGGRDGEFVTALVRTRISSQKLYQDNVMYNGQDLIAVDNSGTGDDYPNYKDANRFIDCKTLDKYTFFSFDNIRRDNTEKNVYLDVDFLNSKDISRFCDIPRHASTYEHHPVSPKDLRHSQFVYNTTTGTFSKKRSIP